MRVTSPVVVNDQLVRSTVSRLGNRPQAEETKWVLGKAVGDFEALARHFRGRRPQEKKRKNKEKKEKQTKTQKGLRIMRSKELRRTVARKVGC